MKHISESIIGRRSKPEPRRNAYYNIKETRRDGREVIVVTNIYPDITGTFHNVFTPENIYDLFMDVIFGARPQKFHIRKEDTFLEYLSKYADINSSRFEFKIFVGEKNNPVSYASGSYLNPLNNETKTAIWKGLAKAAEQGLLDKDVTNVKLSEIRMVIHIHNNKVFCINVYIL